MLSYNFIVTFKCLYSNVHHIHEKVFIPNNEHACQHLQNSTSINSNMYLNIAKDMVYIVLIVEYLVQLNIDL